MSPLRSMPIAGGLALLIASSPAFTQGASAGVLVKGAWSSSSDSGTPIPEAGEVGADSYVNPYFGLTYPLPAGWIQKYEGPPPSDSGYYVLAQLSARESSSRATLLILAHDLFFTPVPAGSALQLINDVRSHLARGYSIERPPSQVRVGGHTFVSFAFGAPAIGLHWSMLATQIRCHIVQWVYTSPDPALLDKLIGGVSEITFAAKGNDEPVCVKDYATAQNLVESLEPVFTEPRANPIPVRVIIDKEGKVRHIHFLSAFPSESQAITVALAHWRFKPYTQDGRAVEVETGILFGRRER